MKRTGPTNPQIRELVTELKTLSIKEKAAIWKRVAEDLQRPSRNRRAVNISRINQFTKEGENIIVPGKVLGSGSLNHKVTIAAFAFSQSAKDSIDKIGKAILISDVIKSNPKGKKLRIIG